MSRLTGLKGRLHDIVDPRFDAGHWPENTYLAIAEHRLLYCPIPKVACTSFKTLCVALSEHKIPLGRGLHRRAHNAYSLSRLRRSEAQRILEDPDWFKFVFVRNPWDRLVSAFYSKFVRARTPIPFAVAVMNEVSRHQGEAPAEERRISFRDFVDHVCRTPDDRLDEHWKPQYCFLGDSHFDFIGRFECLPAHFSRMAAMQGLPQDALPMTNFTPYDPTPDQRAQFGSLADVSAAELGQLDALPDFRRLYTPELAARVEQRYQRDVAWFGYGFDAQCDAEPILPAIMNG